MSLAFDIKVCADFYDPARRVGAEVKHVKNVKELYNFKGFSPARGTEWYNLGCEKRDEIVLAERPPRRS